MPSRQKCHRRFYDVVTFRFSRSAASRVSLQKTMRFEIKRIKKGVVAGEKARGRLERVAQAFVHLRTPLISVVATPSRNLSTSQIYLYSYLISFLRYFFPRITRCHDVECARGCEQNLCGFLARSREMIGDSRTIN